MGGAGGLPAGQPADPEPFAYLPFSSHGPSSVRAARDRARGRPCRGLRFERHDTTHPARPGSPPSSAPPSLSVQSSRPFPPHDRPEGRRRPLTTHRNGSAHPPLPKSACLSASCRANAPARPDRRVRPCSLGSTSFPAPVRPVPAGLRPPHLLSIWPARQAGARTSGRHAARKILPARPTLNPHHQAMTPFRLHGPDHRSATVPTARQARRLGP